MSGLLALLDDLPRPAAEDVRYQAGTIEGPETSDTVAIIVLLIAPLLLTLQTPAQMTRERAKTSPVEVRDQDMPRRLRNRD